ncbi:(Fe-S)-binding protein [Synechococcus sp. CS-1328]|uniref:(Fe-S)-binding protein n=1 Tax=Synechococcus sp. CS-1328 TaxID=2847976 RepID=UPI00223A8F24|nr:(Fe-S)-binding protein [Synechococcus sp. CS-1328]MCT0223901.1 (Fe-S)-binding protein [Synechococcus sp. CS-1328]
MMLPSPAQTSRLTAVTDPCVHCGFCLPTCASYRVLGTEMDSPRGRIHALKAIAAGELELDATVASHFDSCLGCFACVSACPSGVRYDELIEATRPQLNAPELRTPAQRSFRRLLFALLPYPQRLRALLTPLRAYAGTPLQAMARRSGLLRLLGPQIEAMERLLPPLPAEGFADGFPVVVPAIGQRRYRVGLVLGCVQRLFDPAVNAAAVRVLRANGIEVVIPPAQGCCGAMTQHQGEEVLTRSHATALIDSFAAVVGPGRPAGAEPLDAVLVAASGCGHTLKHYDALLASEPAWAARGSAFAAGVADLQEFLERVGLSEAFRQGLQPLDHADGSRASADRPLRLAYHDACHMLHGQGIREQPRALLRAIPHVEIREAVEAGVCCGSAGIYNLVQPEEAAALGRIKADDLRGTGADLVVSANIGCSLQIRRHLDDTPGEAAPLPVLHPVQLLERSFRATPA